MTGAILGAACVVACLLYLTLAPRYCTVCGGFGVLHGVADNARSTEKCPACDGTGRRS
jgi:DnaJ-class molecular chaperone